MSKRIIGIWLAVLLVFLAGIIIWGSQSLVACWDGFEVDEDLMMDLCGITGDEYFSLDFKYEDCPRAEEAVYMVGSCEPMWFLIWGLAGGFLVVYLVLSAIGYGIWVLRKRKTQAQ